MPLTKEEEIGQFMKMTPLSRLRRDGNQTRPVAQSLPARPASAQAVVTSLRLRSLFSMWPQCHATSPDHRDEDVLRGDLVCSRTRAWCRGAWATDIYPPPPPPASLPPLHRGAFLLSLCEQRLSLSPSVYQKQLPHVCSKADIWSGTRWWQQALRDQKNVSMWLDFSAGLVCRCISTIHTVNLRFLCWHRSDWLKLFHLFWGVKNKDSVWVMSLWIIKLLHLNFQQRWKTAPKASSSRPHSWINLANTTKKQIQTEINISLQLFGSLVVVNVGIFAPGSSSVSSSEWVERNIFKGL